MKRCSTCKGTGKVKWDFRQGATDRDVREVRCPNPDCFEGMIVVDTERRISNLLTSINCPDASGVLRNIMTVIEADREAVHAETREELLKTHFAMGEDVQYQFLGGGGWSDGKIGVQSAGRIYADVNVRRRPKMRRMTHGELASRVSEVYSIGKEEAKSLNGDTLADLLRNRGFPVQVEE